MMSVELNAFHVMFSGPAFTASVSAFPNPNGVATLRKEYGDEWFLYWRGAKLYGIPKVDQPRRQFGQPQKLTWGGENDHDHLHLLTARLTDQLPEKFPERHVLR